MFEIGGADVTSYARHHARVRPPARPAPLLIPVPVLTPHLSSLWLGLTTPIYARVGRKLIESLRNATVVRDDRSLRTFRRSTDGPGGGARARADLTRTRDSRRRAGTTRSPPAAEPPSYGGVRFGSRLVDSRAVTVRRAARGGLRAHPADRRPHRLVLRQLRSGGCAASSTSSWAAPGCAAAGAIPSTCGSATRSISGASRLRARPAPAPGRRDAPPRPRLAPVRGRAEGGGTTIRQTAIFDPVGLVGPLYWYAIYPLHARVFGGMLRGIAAAAVAFHDQACRGSVPETRRAPTDPFAVREPERA